MERTKGRTEAEHNAIESASARAHLPPERLAILEAIIAGGRLRLAWMPAVELMAAGHCPDAVEDMIQAKLIDTWVLNNEQQLTLSRHAAWIMQVHILERLSVLGEEIEEDPYWAELDREPQSLVLPKRRHEIRWPWMDEMPDPKSVKRPGEVMRDEEGEEVRLMGMTVPIDRRMAKAKGKQAKAKRRRAG